MIIITGACGVGKTTVARAWAKLTGGAAIESDLFTEWIQNEEFPHWTAEEEQFTAELSATVARKYLSAGMPVAIENVWSPAGVRILKKELSSLPDHHQIRVVRLYCSPEENHRRDEMRIPENRMYERVDIVHKELAQYNWPDDVLHLDTTNLDVRSTVIHLMSNHFS